MTVLALLIVIVGVRPADGQLDRFKGDRPPDRPIPFPPVSSDVAGAPSGASSYLQGIGPSPPSDVLKELDKDLGKSSVDSPGYLRDPRFGPSETFDKEPPARTTLGK